MMRRKLGVFIRALRQFLILWRGKAPRPSYRLERAGWLLLAMERLFRYLNFSSCGQLGRAFFRFQGRKQSSGGSSWSVGVYEARFVDCYVVFSAILLAIALGFTIPANSGVRAVAVVLSIYVMWEVFHRTVNVLLFDHLRGDPEVASIQRSLILGFINYLEIIVGYAVLIAVWLPHSVLGIGDSGFRADDVAPAIWASFQTATLTEMPHHLEGYEWILPAAEVLTSLWVLAVLLAWVTGALPRRA